MKFGDEQYKNELEVADFTARGLGIKATEAQALLVAHGEVQRLNRLEKIIVKRTDLGPNAQGEVIVKCERSGHVILLSLQPDCPFCKEVDQLRATLEEYRKRYGKLNHVEFDEADSTNS